MFDKKVYYKKYYQEHREKYNGYIKKYRARPEVKERLKEYQKIYLQRPEVKERLKEYNKGYRQRHKSKKYRREYIQKPEIKERRKDYYQKNKDKIRIRAKVCRKIWRMKNLELAREKDRNKRREWYKLPENKKKCCEYQRKKRLTDPIYKERAYIRSYSNHRYKAKKCYCCNGFGYGLHHYTESYEIDKVIPLCSTCHKKIHDKVIQVQFTEEDTKKSIEQGYLQKL